jgi:membrane protease YdiL (CAAX protease family)
MNILEITKQLNNINIAEAAICLTGLFLLAYWLLKTSLGRNALADSIPRRNNMPFYLPFVLLFLWFGSVPLIMLIAQQLVNDLPDWQNALLDNLIICVCAILTTVVIIYLAGISFVLRLKGFGLNIKTIHRDFFAACINLLSIWPLMLAAILATIYVGRHIFGQDFKLEQHEELELITAYSQLSIRIIIVIIAVVLAPVLEEMLFRGLFQTMMRSFLEFRFSNIEPRYSPWLAILISSGLFAMAHANAGHWPALFLLAMCMGYSYEKSGSLLRPIFIHSFFNATAIIATLAK